MSEDPPDEATLSDTDCGRRHTERENVIRIPEKKLLCGDTPMSPPISEWCAD